MLESLFYQERKTRTQSFSCEFCEIWKHTFIIEHLHMTASVMSFISQ